MTADAPRPDAAHAANRPLFTARGATTRSFRHWRDVLVATLVLTMMVGAPALMLAGGASHSGGACAIASMIVVLLAFVALVMRGWTRSSVTLYCDRLLVAEGDRGSRARPATIQLASIRHLALHGATIQLFTGRGFDRQIVTLNPGAAEDLFDHLTDHLEQGLHQRFSSDDRGALNCSAEWSFAELFPWQQSTDTAAIRVEADGVIEARTARDERFAGVSHADVELQEPGAELMTTEPILRLEHDRIHAADGIVLAKVVTQSDADPPGARRSDRGQPDAGRVEFSNGVTLAWCGDRVEYNGVPVGELRSAPPCSILELVDPLPEPVALIALMVWARANHRQAGDRLGGDAEAGSTAGTTAAGTPPTAGSSSTSGTTECDAHHDGNARHDFDVERQGSTRLPRAEVGDAAPRDRARGLTAGGGFDLPVLVRPRPRHRPVLPRRDEPCRPGCDHLLRIRGPRGAGAGARPQRATRRRVRSGLRGDHPGRVGTVTLHDADGEALYTIRFVQMPALDPVDLCNGMASTVYRLREEQPELALMLLADGAHEMWNLLEPCFPIEVFGARKRLVDFFHIIEKLSGRGGGHPRRQASRRCFEAMASPAQAPQLRTPRDPG